MCNPAWRRGKLQGLIVLGLLPAIIGGCAEKQKPAEIISLEGKIEKIERATDSTGTITVTYFSEKQKQEISGVGQVTKETEIMIDGAVSSLKDLREGERVRGEVQVEKKAGARVLTVLKIHVNRPKTGAGG